MSRLRVFYSSAIRQDYLNETRIQQLNELGMVWDHHDALWEHNYRSAKAFYAAHGHLRIPEEYRDEDGVRIGTWIRNMRSRYRQSNGASLSPQQNSGWKRSACGSNLAAMWNGRMAMRMPKPIMRSIMICAYRSLTAARMALLWASGWRDIAGMPGKDRDPGHSQAPSIAR